MAAALAERLAIGETLGSIARAALLDSPLMEPAQTVDLLVEGHARLHAHGPAAATSAARASSRALLAESSSSPLDGAVDVGRRRAGIRDVRRQIADPHGSHLYRVYPKLGITSRSQLHLVLPLSGARAPVAAS